LDITTGWIVVGGTYYQEGQKKREKIHKEFKKKGINQKGKNMAQEMLLDKISTEWKLSEVTSVIMTDRGELIFQVIPKVDAVPKTKVDRCF